MDTSTTYRKINSETQKFLSPSDLKNDLKGHVNNLLKDNQFKNLIENIIKNILLNKSVNEEDYLTISSKLGSYKESKGLSPYMINKIMLIIIGRILFINFFGSKSNDNKRKWLLYRIINGMYEGVLDFILNHFDKNIKNLALQQFMGGLSKIFKNKGIEIKVSRSNDEST